MKIIVIQIFLTMIFVSAGLGDTVLMKNGFRIYGQVLKVTPRTVLLETIKPDGNGIIKRTLDIQKIDKITDDSGVELFVNGKVKVDNFTAYYNKIVCNWEQLRDTTKKKGYDTIILVEGRKKTGKIISVTEKFVFLQLEDSIPANRPIKVDRIKMKDILRVNSRLVVFPQYLPEVKKKLYPRYFIGTGVSYSSGHYSGLRNVFQQVYDANSNDFVADNHKDAFTGIPVIFGAQISREWGLLLNIHFFHNTKKESKTLSFADINYRFANWPLKPGFGIGMAFHDYSSRESHNGVDYTWQSSTFAPLIRVGGLLGNDRGNAVTFSLAYMPFKKAETHIDKEDDIQTSKIDRALFYFSICWQYGF